MKAKEVVFWGIIFAGLLVANRLYIWPWGLTPIFLALLAWLVVSLAGE